MPICVRNQFERQNGDHRIIWRHLLRPTDINTVGKGQVRGDTKIIKILSVGSDKVMNLLEQTNIQTGTSQLKKMGNMQVLLELVAYCLLVFHLKLLSREINIFQDKQQIKWNLWIEIYSKKSIKACLSIRKGKVV